MRSKFHELFLRIKLEAEADIDFHAKYFFDHRGPQNSHDFVVAVQDTILRLLGELDKNVFRGKVGEVWKVPIRGRKSSPTFAKNFPLMAVWCVVDDSEQMVSIFAVEYVTRDTEKLDQMIQDRLKGLE